MCLKKHEHLMDHFRTMREEDIVSPTSDLDHSRMGNLGAESRPLFLHEASDFPESYSYGCSAAPA